MAAAAMALTKIERAHQMYRQGRYHEALEFYTEALTIAKTKPQKIALHSNRAACHLKLHDFKKAAEECTSVLELDHQHTGALMLRAQTLVTLKEYQSALFDVNRLMELNPSSEVYKNLQARIKTQLSLAPIPESEEEALIAEEELDNKTSIAEKEHDNKTRTTNVEVDLSDRCDSAPKTNNEADSAQEVIRNKDRNKLDENTKQQSDQAETAALNTQKALIQNKNNDSVTVIKEANVTCRPDADKHATVNPKEQKATSQPMGHSRLDYSRWDRVDSDSSEDDEDDEEEEEQPRYRFRVRTFGVCPVK